MSDDHDTPLDPRSNGVDEAGSTHTPAGKFAPRNGLGQRFAKGNKHGRGNPLAVKMHEGRMQFLDAIAAGTLPALAKRLQVAALEGDLKATKLLLSYCLGRPQQAVELTGAGGEPPGAGFAAVTTVVLNALSGPEHAEVRVRIAADLMRLDDARDDDA
jgi:hypothetical protein